MKRAWRRGRRLVHSIFPSWWPHGKGPWKRKAKEAGEGLCPGLGAALTAQGRGPTEAEEQEA